MKTLDRDTVVKEILQILKGIDNRKMREDDKIPQRIGLYGLKEDLKTLVEDVTKGSSLGAMSLDSHRVQIISHTQKTKFAFINRKNADQFNPLIKLFISLYLKFVLLNTNPKIVTTLNTPTYILFFTKNG